MCDYPSVILHVDTFVCHGGLFVIIQQPRARKHNTKLLQVNDKLHHYKNPTKRVGLVQSGHHYQPPNVSYSLHDIVAKLLIWH